MVRIKYNQNTAEKRKIKTANPSLLGIKVSLEIVALCATIVGSIFGIM